jgi:hypothetical protein
MEAIASGFTLYEKSAYLCQSGEFRIQNNADGKGDFISKWERCENQKPSEQLLNSLESDSGFLSYIDKKRKEESKYSKSKRDLIDEIESLKARIEALEKK